MTLLPYTGSSLCVQGKLVEFFAQVKPFLIYVNEIKHSLVYWMSVNAIFLDKTQNTLHASDFINNG